MGTWNGFEGGDMGKDSDERRGGRKKEGKAGRKRDRETESTLEVLKYTPGDQN